MHLIPILFLEFLQHLRSLGHSRLGMPDFLSPDALRHLLFQLLIHLLLPKDLHPLSRTDQYIGLLLIILRDNLLQIDIQILNRIKFLPALEHFINILELAHL